MQNKISNFEHLPIRGEDGAWKFKKGFGVNFGFSGNNDSDIIPKTSRYHPEGRGLVKMSVLKGRGI